jgi:hypothetical protein
MMISKLRNPISKSIKTVLWPRIASPEEIAAEDVVFPTPPLPEVTTIILANSTPFLSIREKFFQVYTLFSQTFKIFLSLHGFQKNNTLE